MPGPPMPADVDMIPWAQAAIGDGEDYLDPIWYVPIIRALNERLLAAQRLPIPEGQDSLGEVVGSGFIGEFTDGAATLWGNPGLHTQVLSNFLPFVDGSHYAFHLHNPYVELDITAISSRVITASISDSPPAAGVTASSYDAGSITIDTNLAAWDPLVGDPIKFNFTDNPPFGSILFSAYPEDYRRSFIGFIFGTTGYKYFQVLIHDLMRDYIDDATITLINGAVRGDLQNACEQSRVYKTTLIGSIGDIIHPDVNDADYYFQWFIPSLFERYHPWWPPKTPPGDWAGGHFGGFTRKREREITNTSDAGADGQVARFIYSTGGQYEDGQFNFSFDDMSQTFPGITRPHPATPIGQKDFSTLVMLHTGGVWTIHPDQTALPDILTFYGLARPGDIMGPWIINDIKDAINLMTKTRIDRRFALSQTVIPPYVMWNNPAEEWGHFGDDVSSSSHMASPAGAVTNYTSATNDPSLLGFGSCYKIATVFQYPSSGNTYFCQSVASRVYYWRPRNPFTRSVSFYFTSEFHGYTDQTPDGLHSISLSPDDGTGINGYLYGEETHSGTVYTGKMFLFGTSDPSIDDHVKPPADLVGQDIPWVSIGTFPTPIAGDFLATTQEGGANPIGIVVDWSEGFSYTS